MIRLYVEIIEVDNKANTSTIGKFLWDGKKVTIDGDRNKLTMLIQGGLYNRYEHKEDEIVQMGDGLLFLENLQYNFWGSRLWATEVKQS